MTDKGGTAINGTSEFGLRKPHQTGQWADGNIEYNIDDRNSIPDTTSDLVIVGVQMVLLPSERLRLLRSFF